MFVDHGVKGFNAHKASTKITQFFLPLLYHIIGQGCRQAAHGKKRQGAGFQYHGGKICIVRNIGHGSLDQRILCGLILCKGRILHHWIMLVNRIKVFPNGCKKGGYHGFKTSGFPGKLLGKKPVLTQIKQGLDKRGWAVQRGYVVGDGLVNLSFPVNFIGDQNRLLLEIFNNFGT